MRKNMRDEFKRLTRSDATLLETLTKNSVKIEDNTAALFATNAFEKIDVTLNKPKYKYFWAQEMPIIYGGGAIESISFLRQTFSKPDPLKILASGTTNQIYMVDERVQKLNTPIIPLLLGAEMGLIDQMKYEQVGYDRWGSKMEAVNRDYNEALDALAFHGHVFEDQEYYGLYNNPHITRTDAKKNWDVATIDNLLDDFLGACIGIVKDLEYDVDASVAPNHISIPIDLFRSLAVPTAIGGVSVVVSKLEYLTNQLNKFLASYGTSVTFYPSRFLAEGQDDDGDNDKGRAVVMCHDPSVFRMPIAMPLTRGATVNLSVLGMQTHFVAFVGVPQFVWPSAIRYIDNIVDALEVSMTASLSIDTSVNDVATIVTTYANADSLDDTYVVDGYIESSETVPAGTTITINPPAIGGTQYTVAAPTKKIWLSDIIKGQNSAVGTRPKANTVSAEDTFVYTIVSSSAYSALLTVKVVVSNQEGLEGTSNATKRMTSPIVIGQGTSIITITED